MRAEYQIELTVRGDDKTVLDAYHELVAQLADQQIESVTANITLTRKFRPNMRVVPADLDPDAVADALRLHERRNGPTWR